MVCMFETALDHALDYALDMLGRNLIYPLYTS